MKVFMLADGSSIHTIRWVKGLNRIGHEVSLFSLNRIDEELSFLKHYYSANLGVGKSKRVFFSKLQYLRVLRQLKSRIEFFQPDILHAHYATSYGLLGALSGFHPFIISIWGSDVYDFPKKSPLHKAILKFNLSKADKILSTSKVMAKEAAKYTGKQLVVTPFGIDLNRFKPEKRKSKLLNCREHTVIGTVKTLESKYGIEYLIRAFKELILRGHQRLKLVLVGKGSLQNHLEELVDSLDIKEQVIFVGWVPHAEIPSYHSLLDIAVYPSVLDSESFGVSVIESGACEVPVVVSNKGGLIEVVEEGKTGLIAQAKNVKSLADKIELLLKDKEKRDRMGKAARERVAELYDWNKNLKQMDNIYKQLKKD